MFAFLFSTVVSEEEPILEGTYSKAQQFLPLLPPGKVNAKLLLLDYPDNRVPIKRFMRASAAFTSLDKSSYVFQELIGHIVDPKDETHYVWNMSTYGTSGRVSNEDTITHMHYCQLDQDMIPGTYKVDFYASLLDENSVNHSVLLYNGTLTFYETIDYKFQVGAVLLYVFFASLLLGIVFLIFSKDKAKTPKPVDGKKKIVKDYNEIHQVPRSDSPSSGRGASPGRKASPSKK